MMLLRVGRFREKPGVNLARWIYVAWVESTKGELGYNAGLNDETIKEGSGELRYNPDTMMAEVDEIRVVIPEWVEKMVEAMNCIGDREGLIGVSDAGTAILEDIKILALKTYAMGKRDNHPLVARWASWARGYGNLFEEEGG